MARTKQVLLRLTEEEHSRLKELAGREPVSAYLRRMAGLEGEPPKVKEYHSVGPAPVFRCPVHGCEFRAMSDKARCNDHGRAVVPVA